MPGPAVVRPPLLLLIPKTTGWSMRYGLADRREGPPNNNCSVRLFVFSVRTEFKSRGLFQELLQSGFDWNRLLHLFMHGHRLPGAG